METKKEMPVIPEAFIKAVECVLAAQAHLDLIRPKIESIQQKILNENIFMSKEMDAGKRGILKSERITNIKHDWLMTDVDFEKYWKMVDAEYRKAGYIDLEFGKCPLLVAGNLLIQARQVMVSESKFLNPGFNPEEIYELDLLRKYEELLIGLAIASGKITTGQILNRFVPKDVLV